MDWKNHYICEAGETVYWIYQHAGRWIVDAGDKEIGEAKLLKDAKRLAEDHYHRSLRNVE